LVRPWKAILAALIIFLAGAVSGGVGIPLYRAKAAKSARLRRTIELPAPPALQRIEFLRRTGAKLDLTPEQQEHIDRHLQQAQQRIRKLWEPVAPEAQEELRQLRRQIREELRPAQRERFDQLLRERQARPAADTPERRRPETQNGGPVRKEQPGK
jgi:hypothetical protein